MQIPAGPSPEEIPSRLTTASFGALEPGRNGTGTVNGIGSSSPWQRAGTGSVQGVRSQALPGVLEVNISQKISHKEPGGTLGPPELEQSPPHHMSQGAEGSSPAQGGGTGRIPRVILQETADPGLHRAGAALSPRHTQPSPATESNRSSKNPFSLPAPYFPLL